MQGTGFHPPVPFSFLNCTVRTYGALMYWLVFENLGDQEIGLAVRLGEGC